MILFSFSLAAGDFNDDHYLDLAIANYGTDNIGIFYGNGNNTFTNQVTFSTGRGSRPSSIAVGHFNDDTHLDITVANYGTNTIGVFLNSGKGTFPNHTIYSTDPSSPYWIGVNDFNRDNRLDLVVTNKGTNNKGCFLDMEMALLQAQ